MPPKHNIKKVPRIRMATNNSPGRPGLRSNSASAAAENVQPPPIDDDASFPADSDAASTARTAPEDSFAPPNHENTSKQNLQDEPSKEDDSSAVERELDPTVQDEPSKEDDTSAVERELDPNAGSSVIGVEDKTDMDVEATTKEDTTTTEKTKETSDNIPPDAPTQESNNNISRTTTNVADRTQNVQSETADESSVHSTNNTGMNDADNNTNANKFPSTPPQSKTAIDPPKSKEKELESFINATTNSNARVNVSYSMLPFLLLLDVDKNDELTIGMPNVNWNTINIDVALELFLKMIGNPYQRKDGNQAKPMAHDMVLLMIQTDDKVSEPHSHRPMPLARTSIFREKIVKM